MTFIGLQWSVPPDVLRSASSPVARILAVLALATLFGCAAPERPTPQLGTRQVSPDMLLHASPLAAGVEMDDLAQVDILGVTPEMAAFLDREVGGLHSRLARLRRLVEVVLGEDHFNLVYEDSTRTAQETFQEGHGNCLSFTNMFIAMARYLDIPANYQEVDMPPDWSLAGESFLFSQHVNAHVDLGVNLINVVDFYGYNMELAEKRRIISDQRGRAHYFNNIAVDYMLADDTPRAFAEFLNSIRADQSFAPAWINLGILHRRAGLAAYAEAAYLQALDLEPSNMSAMSNLANLYEEEGYPELAAFYDERVEAHRMQNPYYRYKLAQTAVMDGDYAASIEHLQYAIDLLPAEDRFYSLLSVSYLMSGDRAQAQQWMAKAESMAVKDADRQRYHSKLEWLMSQKVEK